MVEADSHLKLLPSSILDIAKCLSTLICYSWAYGSSLTQLYSPYLAQVLGLWVTCGVNMMWICHGWGWQPPQTASHIHIRHIWSVWAHWYAVHGHMVAALHSYTHPNWLRFWGSGSLVESKWCDYVMFEADSHLKLLPTSILHIYKAVSLTPKYQKAIQPSDRARGALWNNCCFAKTMFLFDKWNISEKPKISTH